MTEASDNLPVLAGQEDEAGMGLVVAPMKQAVEMTPALARVQAVAHVLQDAMSKASTLKLTKEESDGLKADFPDDAFRLGAGGNPDLLYVEHAWLRDRFDSVLGMGQWALVRTRPHWGEDYSTKSGKATRIYADCALLVRGCLVSEAIGEMSYFHNNFSQTYGDAAEGSVTAAFRRCAKQFGVGLQAWKKDFCVNWMAKHGRNRPVPVEQKPVPVEQKPVPVQRPVAKTADVIETPAQRKARFLAKFHGIENYAKEFWIELGIIPSFAEFNEFPDDKVPETAKIVWDMVQEVKKRAGVGDPPSVEADDTGSGPVPPPTAGRVCPNCQSINYVEMRSAGKLWWRCEDCKREGQVVRQDEKTVKQVMANVTGAEEAWRSVPVPEWSKHRTEEGFATFGDLPKEKLWWWCVFWQPKPYTSPKNGKTYPVKKEELELRSILDDLKEQYDFKE
jgi:hypothetical protein